MNAIFSLFKPTTWKHWFLLNVLSNIISKGIMKGVEADAKAGESLQGLAQRIIITDLLLLVICSFYSIYFFNSLKVVGSKGRYFVGFTIAVLWAVVFNDITETVKFL